MDHQRILCTYLSLAPTGILTSSTLQVIPTLLRNAYNPEGLARSFVATINRHLFSLKDSMGLQSVNIESVQEYWSNISMGDTSPPLDEGIHDLLSTAYNEVVFAWVTDFLLYREYSFPSLAYSWLTPPPLPSSSHQQKSTSTHPT